jgi:hypothetical protein
MEPDRQFAQAGYDAERRLLAGVEPHWPTYHRVMRLCGQLADCLDACRHRDAGDIIANKDALHELSELLDSLDVDTESQAGGIYDTITRTKRVTEKQAKALAMAAAKAATLAGRK